MPSGTFHYYLCAKLNADATSGLDSCIVTEKIVKLSCMVRSLYFTMAEPKRRYLVPGYRNMQQVLP